MARPRDPGLLYFPLDVDFFSDLTIRILRVRYGADGITFYVYLLCQIYRLGYYMEWTEDTKIIAADDLNMSCEKVQQILKFLLGRSLFDDKLFQSDTILTSAGIQKRYQEAVEGKARKNPIIIKDYWLLSEAETKPWLKVVQFEGYSGNNGSYSGNNEGYSGNNGAKQNKTKEKKGKETTSKGDAEKKKVFITLPALYGQEFDVSYETINALKSVFPNINLEQEFKAMLLWLESNPERRRSTEEMMRFINGWLRRTDKKFSPTTNITITGKEDNVGNFTQREYSDEFWDNLTVDLDEIGRSNDETKI